jgi:hypothetical protein
MLFATEPPQDVYARLYNSRQETVRRHQTEMDELGARHLAALNTNDVHLKNIAELRAALKRRDEEIANLKAGGGAVGLDLASVKAEAAEWKRKFTALEDLVEIRKNPNATVHSILLATIYKELEAVKLKEENWKQRYQRAVADATRGGDVAARIAEERKEHDNEVKRLLRQLEMLEKENRDLNEENASLDLLRQEERKQRLLFQYPAQQIGSQRPTHSDQAIGMLPTVDREYMQVPPPSDRDSKQGASGHDNFTSSHRPIFQTPHRGPAAGAECANPERLSGGIRGAEQRSSPDQKTPHLCEDRSNLGTTEGSSRSISPITPPPWVRYA